MDALAEAAGELVEAAISKKGVEPLPNELK
jgi:hypothetical protein